MFATTKRWWTLLLGLTLVLLAFDAAASGRAVWKKTRVKESNESWRLDLEFHMQRTPDIAIVPMRFEFTPDVYYERTLVDGRDDPVVTRQPLQDRQPLVETVDANFMDPGTAQIQKRTRFTFKLTRDRGFEAGEYKVTIEDKRNGRKLSRNVRLVLDGENPVVDRRSISFDPSKKKKKKEPTPEEQAEMEDPPDPDSEEFWEGGPLEEDNPDGESLPPPAHMQERPCACRVPGQESNGYSWVVLLFALGGALLVRRRGTA